MLLVSFLLVLVATIFLLSGLFLTRDLPLIFVSIGCSALAGLVLVVAVLRSRPKPVAEPEGLGADDTVAADFGAGEMGAGDMGAESATPTREARTQPPRAARTFPIPDYDSLEVVEVLPLLGDLDAAGLEMIRKREASGRAHPWVLARIDALLESEAETGEVEWAPVPEEGEPEEAEWAPEAEWAEERSEWAAADFPLEGPGGSYGDIEVMRDFPIDGYHELRANEVLPLLTNLDPEDLKMVREEEESGKARTSVLSRIDVLLAKEQAGRPAARSGSRSQQPSSAALALPIADYDRLTVTQITSQLRSLSVEELKAIRDYEQRHKARTGVLSKVETALNRAR